MRLILINFILLILLSSCYFGSISDFSEADIHDNKNEVFNSGFELGEYSSDTYPEDWISLDANENNIFWDNSISHSGEKSLKIDTNKKVNIVSEAFNIDPLGVYYSRSFIKSKDNLAQSVTISFIAFNKNGVKVDKFSNTILVSDEWSIINLTTGFYHADAVFGRIVLTVKTKKDHPIWLDDVVSYKVYKIK